jgi:IclR family transcriptional regulator, acetate operon repressor
VTQARRRATDVATPGGPAGPARSERGVYDVAVLQKALDLLEVLADRPNLGLSELSEQTGASKASSYRVLSTLESRGFLVKDPVTRKYSPGPRLIAVSYGVVGRLDLVGIARTSLEALHNEFNETVNLGVLVENRVLYVDMLESPQTLRTAASAGSKDPLHCTALGKAILSAMPADDARAILKTYKRLAPTSHTRTSLEDLMTELAVTRVRGYSVDNEENELGSRCVGVPLLGRSGEVVGAVSVSGPAVRLPESQLARIGTRLIAARHEIERGLGAVAIAQAAE